MLRCVNRECKNDISKGGGRLLQWTSVSEPMDGKPIPHGHRFICEPCWLDLTGSKFSTLAVEPRSEIKLFAFQMEQRLRESESKRAPIGGRISWPHAENLLQDVSKYVNQLRRAIRARTLSSDERDLRIRRDAPELANSVMRIHQLWVDGKLLRSSGESV